MSIAKINLSDVNLDRPLTLLCHRDDVDIVNDRPDVMDITPEMTLAMAARFTPQVWDKAKADPDFVARMKVMYPDLDILTDPQDLSDYPIGIRHVVGLIICTNMAINTGKIPHWRYPETYLHPSTQANLASLAIMYQKGAEEAVKET